MDILTIGIALLTAAALLLPRLRKPKGPPAATPPLACGGSCGGCPVDHSPSTGATPCREDGKLARKRGSRYPS